MIVTVGIDEGLSVLIDDQIEDYNPIRARELMTLARETFAEAMADARQAANVVEDEG